MSELKLPLGFTRIAKKKIANAVSQPDFVGILKTREYVRVKYESGKMLFINKYGNVFIASS